MSQAVTLWLSSCKEQVFFFYLSQFICLLGNQAPLNQIYNLTPKLHQLINRSELKHKQRLLGSADLNSLNQIASLRSLGSSELLND